MFPKAKINNIIKTNQIINTQEKKSLFLNFFPAPFLRNLIHIAFRHLAHYGIEMRIIPLDNSLFFMMRKFNIFISI